MIKRTKRTQTQATLALPLDDAASDARMEAAVQAAEATFLAKATPAPAAAAPAIIAPPPAEAAPAAHDKTPAAAGGEARAGRETLYIVAAMQWGEVRGKRGTRQGWKRLPDAAFKGKSQALRAAALMVEGGRATGAVAVEQTADTDMGDYDEPVVIGRFGRMPEEFMAA